MRGSICVVTRDAGNLGLSDSLQLEFAAAHGRAIVTANQRDFVALHSRWVSQELHHAGIIIVTDQLIPPGLLIAKLCQLQARAREQLADTILFVNATPLKETP